MYSDLHNVEVSGQHIESGTVTAEEFPIILAVIIMKRVICFNIFSTEMEFIYFRKRWQRMRYEQGLNL